MQTSPISKDEANRLEVLHDLGVLDTKPEARFDALTKEAVEKLKVPMSMVSIIDKDREWFKSCVGWDKSEGERAVSFCGHALLAENMFIIADTLKDQRFYDNPMVVGPPYIRFYAGMSLCEYSSNQPIGVFCIKDTRPRNLSVEEISIFMDLAKRVEQELNKK